MNHDPSSYRPKAPTSRTLRALCLVLGVAAIALSIGWQIWQLALESGYYDEHPMLAAPSPAQQTRTTSNINLNLFGSAGQVTSTISKQLPVQLLACFVATSKAHSSALLKVEGQPARHIRLGEQLLPGVRLIAVNERSARLNWQGQEQILSLARNAQRNAATSSPDTTPLY